jgi:hypothetical protein
MPLRNIVTHIIVGISHELFLLLAILRWTAEEPRMAGCTCNQVLDILKGATTVSMVGPKETPPIYRIKRKRACAIFMPSPDTSST